jgi:hypothetical protein
LPAVDRVGVIDPPEDLSVGHGLERDDPDDHAENRLLDIGGGKQAVGDDDASGSSHGPAGSC